MLSSHSYAFSVREDTGGGRLMRTLLDTLAPDELPLAFENELRSTWPALRLWHMDRWIHHPEGLRGLAEDGNTNMDALRTMRPVFFHPEGVTVWRPAAAICEGRWTPTGIVIAGKRALACRADALRTLYMP